MAKNEKTIQDFKKAVAEAKQDFLNQKINYGWDYKIKEEAFPAMDVFWICNTQNARKIIFFHEQNYLINREMFMMDVEVLSEMKEGL